MSSEMRLRISRDPGRGKWPMGAVAASWSFRSRRGTTSAPDDEGDTAFATRHNRKQSNTSRSPWLPLSHNERKVMLPKIHNNEDTTRSGALKQRNSYIRKSIFKDTKLPYLPKLYSSAATGARESTYKCTTYLRDKSENGSLPNIVKKPFLPPLDVIKLNPMTRRRVTPKIGDYCTDLDDFEESPNTKYKHLQNHWRASVLTKGSDSGMSRRDESSWKDLRASSSCANLDDAEKLIVERSKIDLYDHDPFSERSMIPGLQPRQSTNKRIHEWLKANEALHLGNEVLCSSRKSIRVLSPRRVVKM